MSLFRLGPDPIFPPPHLAEPEGLLAIGGFLKNMQRNTLGRYLAYRFVLSGAVVLAFWLRNRS